MNKISLFAGIATIAGLGIAGYQLGKESCEGSGAVSVVIINALENSLKNVPPESRPIAENLVSKITNLVEDASVASDKKGVDLKDNEVEIGKALTSLSLADYRADGSPFVPTLGRANLLCDDKFTVTYFNADAENKLFQLNLNQILHTFRPGGSYKLPVGRTTLTITLLEYSEALKGPVFKYECVEKD